MRFSRTARRVATAHVNSAGLDNRDDDYEPAQRVSAVRFLWPRVPHRHLIGPTFFPVYLLVLKVALAVTLVLTAGFAVLGPTGDAESRPRLVEVLIFLIRRGLIAFGSTTLAFAALDLWQSRFFRQTSWDPRLLPAVVQLEDRVSRLDSLIQLVLLSAGLVWLLLVPFFPILILAAPRESSSSRQSGASFTRRWLC